MVEYELSNPPLPLYTPVTWRMVEYELSRPVHGYSSGSLEGSHILILQQLTSHNLIMSYLASLMLATRKIEETIYMYVYVLSISDLVLVNSFIIWFLINFFFGKLFNFILVKTSRKAAFGSFYWNIFDRDKSVFLTYIVYYFR